VEKTESSDGFLKCSGKQQIDRAKYRKLRGTDDMQQWANVLCSILYRS